MGVGDHREAVRKVDKNLYMSELHPSHRYRIDLPAILDNVDDLDGVIGYQPDFLDDDTPLVDETGPSGPPPSRDEPELPISTDQPTTTENEKENPTTEPPLPVENVKIENQNDTTTPLLVKIVRSLI